MAKARGGTIRDMFSNKAALELTMSAANVLSFLQFRFATAMSADVAMLAHKISYWPAELTYNELADSTDHFIVGLVMTDKVDDLEEIHSPGVIDYHGVAPVGTCAEVQYSPLITDWSTLPGGGKLLPFEALHLSMDSSGFVNPGIVRCLVDYTLFNLSEAQSNELFKSLFPVNI